MRLVGRCVVAGLVLATVALGPSAASAAPAGPTLAVNALSGVHTIPPAIYGINFASPRLRAQLAVPVNRWGGNATSLYDFRTNAYNNGSDYFFENQIGDEVNSQLSPWVSANRSTATPSLVAVPMVGWIADATKPTACAFPTSTYPGQDAVDVYRPCGNGLRGGSRITGNDPTTFATAVDRPTYAGAMVQSLVAAHGTASRGGVRFYELDNEPGLWHETHRAVHPAPLSRQELTSNSLATAAAIKAADPSAAILGPSDWGYCGWLYAPADGDPTNGCDGPTSGSTEALSAAYVRAFKAYADAHGGARLLDYLDQHYYPASPNGSPAIALAPSGNAETQARRLRSTRSLWDPTYKDESWIGGVNDVNAPPLQFIRTMRAWASVYPGTKTAITEYNWGGFDSINGALAQADVLGIFGRERLDLATLWNYDDEIDGTPVEQAFRMYRNYDGKNSRFGGDGVGASSTDQGKLSVYAGKGPNVLTIIVINKTTGAFTSKLKLYNFPHRSNALTYTLGPANPRKIVPGSTSIGPGGFAYTYPAQSVTLVRVARA